MEYLLGLTEKNKSLVRRLAEKSSRKIVEVYYKAIRLQHKKALKSVSVRKKEDARATLFFLRVKRTLLHLKSTKKLRR